jgi:anti-sigma B factor antagonist
VRGPARDSSGGGAQIGLLRIVQQAERSTRHRAECDVRLKGDSVDIKVNVREAQGDTYVVDLNGEIDVYTSPKVKDAIGDLIDKGHYNLVINLEKVRYIDSTGLGVLIGGLKRVREHGGTVNLVCTNPQIKKIFDITGLVKIFGIYDDEDAAMKALV